MAQRLSLTCGAPSNLTVLHPSLTTEMILQSNFTGATAANVEAA